MEWKNTDPRETYDNHRSYPIIILGDEICGGTVHTREQWWVSLGVVDRQRKAIFEQDEWPTNWWWVPYPENYQS